MTYKVLLTGMTAQQIGNGTRLGYGPVVDLFRAALEDAGCEVEHRRAVPEEPLKDYDCVFVGQIPLHAMGATYSYGALDVTRRARSEGAGLIFYTDDWQVNNLVSGIKTICRGPWRLTKPLFEKCRKDWDWASAHLDELTPVVEAMRDRPWPITVLPKFGWGDPTNLVAPLNAREFVYVDPSSYATEYPTEIPDDSVRYAQWTLEILSDQREWVKSLNLSWPVDYIGSKKSKADAPLKEPELVQKYAESWGVLSPVYPKLAGTGWWRNRFVYAARTGSVLLGDRREVDAIGDAYHVTGPEVEGMSQPQLRELADTQRKQLEDWQWSKEQVQQSLLDAVKRAIAEVK